METVLVVRLMENATMKTNADETDTCSWLPLGDLGDYSHQRIKALGKDMAEIDEEKESGYSCVTLAGNLDLLMCMFSRECSAFAEVEFEGIFKQG
jgi:hypothetical protein